MTNETVSITTGISPHFAALFEAIPSCSILVNTDAPRYTVLAATRGYYTTTGFTKEAVVGNSLFNTFTLANSKTGLSGTEQLAAVFKTVIETKTEVTLPVMQYPVLTEAGVLAQRTMQVVATPVMEPGGAVSSILQTVTGTTEAAPITGTGKKQWPDEVQSLFLQAPVAICVFRGPEYIVEMVNPLMEEMLGKKRADLEGRSFFTAMPEVRGQGLETLLKQVIEGGASIKIQEQEFALPRPEGLQTAYVNYVYEPLKNNNGEVERIMVVAIDVTGQVTARHKIETSEARFRSLIEEAPVATCLFVGRDLKVEVANQSMLELWGKNETIINKPLAEALPEIQGQPFLQILDDVFTSGKTYVAQEAPAVLMRNGVLETGYFDFTYKPLRNTVGEVYAIMNMAIEVTSQVLAKKKMEESNLQIRSVIESAPFPIGVYEGRKMKIQFANQAILGVWGKGSDVIGKQFTDILPELENQEIFEQLDSVYQSGIAFHAQNQRVDLFMDGQLKPWYFNYSFTPLFNSAGDVYGVMNTAANITDLILAKQIAEESEQNLRNMIVQAPVAMCILQGPQHVIEIANERMFELWGKPAPAVLGKPMFEGVPESKNQGFEDLLQSVYTNGVSFQEAEKAVLLPRNGRLETVYLNFAFEPLRETKGIISGIMAVAIDVTEQVTARKKIEAAEANLRNAVELAELATWSLDIKESTFHYSPVLCSGLALRIALKMPTLPITRSLMTTGSRCLPLLPRPLRRAPRAFIIMSIRWLTGLPARCALFMRRRRYFTMPPVSPKH